MDSDDKSQRGAAVARTTLQAIETQIGESELKLMKVIRNVILGSRTGYISRVEFCVLVHFARFDVS